MTGNSRVELRVPLAHFPNDRRVDERRDLKEVVLDCQNDLVCQYLSDHDRKEQDFTEGVEQLDVRLPQLGKVEVLFDPARFGPELPQGSCLLLLERLLRTKRKLEARGWNR